MPHISLTRRLRRALMLTCLIPATLVLHACGSGLSGKYSDEMGIMEYEFDSDGTVYMNAMGTRVAGEYEIDDSNVIVRGPHGNLVFEMKDEQLVGPMGLILSRRD